MLDITSAIGGLIQRSRATITIEDRELFLTWRGVGLLSGRVGAQYAARGGGVSLRRVV